MHVHESPKNPKILKGSQKLPYQNEKMVDQMMKIGQKENVKFYYNPEEWIFFR